MGELRVETLSKTFKDGTQALKGVSLHVEDREAVFLLGPSGAGKTTTLRIIAGLEEVTQGAVWIRGRNVTTWSPRDRNVAMVYDKHSLFPHMAVFENLAYPLRARRLAKNDIRSRIDAVADTLQISELLDRRPSELSGGQMQRVAIGRALVRDADVFLLDEPISHLDAQLRARMRVEFKRLQREFEATMLYVSHDQLEAMTMADRIILINEGRIEQVAAPQTLFDEPETLFAATFVGEPHMNTFPAQLHQEAGNARLLIAGGDVPIDDDWLGRGPDLSAVQDLIAGIRPQQVTLARPDERGAGIIRGVVFAVETLGSRVVFDVEISGGSKQNVVRVLTSVDQARAFPQELNAPIAVRIDPDFVYLFDAADGRTIRQARFTTMQTI
ncbi:ABC transporter ATP-binding protein [Amorphus orientalis]|uniref:Multiple sugar transport system ATP-binding protein n=1 Tax=Amorphus orientalis TaxID=649198 RepID=A0AAE3VQH9_9HYPH|nr:ABC transporter ATP-binding protein [Amorphus orientalis]MDQ0315906.1 multiple sugar transport system ATP-binding protein [Amorphus orientalis]